MQNHEDQIKRYLQGQCDLLTRHLQQIITSSWETEDGTIVPHEIGMLTVSMRKCMLIAEDIINKYSITKSIA